MLGLFTNRSLHIAAALAADEAVARLRAQVERGTLRGEVQRGGFALRLHGLFVHRFYQPVFRGGILAASSGCALSGRVRTPIVLRIFVWWWIGFSLFWTIAAFIGTQAWGEGRWMPLVGLGFLVAGMFFFRHVNRFVAGLADGLETTIRQVLESVA